MAKVFLNTLRAKFVVYRPYPMGQVRCSSAQKSERSKLRPLQANHLDTGVISDLMPGTFSSTA
ncbi:MAG: hypothetical protein EOO39_40490 [Cytophagaceae bacterium]|nr:MAG: hypothetical protein EOO39_40490 [Cytophagaceae bacterium]